MRIYSLSIVQGIPDCPSTILSTVQDLSAFTFDQRESVGEYLRSFTQSVAERIAQGGQQSEQEGIYTAHVYNRGGAENLAGMSSFHPSAPLEHLHPIHFEG
jgi:synaptobrevin family protein YKT6